MLLGLKNRFVPFVEDGSKTHTIRGKRKRRPRVGETCHVYANPRQKTMRLVGRWPCIRVEEIRITIGYKARKPLYISVWIEGDELSRAEINRLCWVDGFRSHPESEAWREFAEYWAADSRIPLDPGELSFEGDLIHWTREART